MALIGVDARPVYNNNTRGIGNYSFQLFAATFPQTSHQFRLYYERSHDNKPFHLSHQVSDRQLSIRGSRFFTWEQLALPAALRRDKIDLYHAAANTMPWWQPCPTVVTIHDVLLARIDDDETPNFLFYWRKILPLCLAKARRIITVSEFSRQDLMELWKIPGDKVRTIHSGHDNYYTVLPAAERAAWRAAHPEIPTRFVLLLGAQAPRKNTPRVLEAFLNLKRDRPDDLALVITGLQPKVLAELTTRLAGDSAGRDVHLFGFVEKPFLRQLYNAAAAFIYPSLYEGFGFPMLEAMACGTPVTAANRTSLPEIAGDAALLFDPENTGAITRAMERITTDTVLAQQCRERGLQQVQKFAWERAARETLAVYNEVLGET